MAFLGATAPTESIDRMYQVVCRRRSIILQLLTAILIINGVFVSSIAAANELIVNPSLALTRLDKDSVRSMFTMRLRRWPDGTPVRVFVLPDRHPVHRDFSKTILGVFPHQLRRAWDRMVFSGLGQAPTEIVDEAEMLKRVAETPGAVGYLSAPIERRDVSFVEVE